jgi:hypothetical protein
MPQFLHSDKRPYSLHHHCLPSMQHLWACSLLLQLQLRLQLLPRSTPSQYSPSNHHPSLFRWLCPWWWRVPTWPRNRPCTSHSPAHRRTLTNRQSPSPSNLRLPSQSRPKQVLTHLSFWVTTVKLLIVAFFAHPPGLAHSSWDSPQSISPLATTLLLLPLP